MAAGLGGHQVRVSGCQAAQFSPVQHPQAAGGVVKEKTAIGISPQSLTGKGVQFMVVEGAKTGQGELKLPEAQGAADFQAFADIG